MVLSCTCKHEYQDQKYGQGKRIHNEIPGQNGPPSWQCTICDNSRQGATPSVGGGKKG